MSSDLDIYSQQREPIAILRERYLEICDNNHCAAMLLDIFYARAECAEEWNDIRWGREEETDPCVYSTFPDLAEDLFGLFEVTTVQTAFMLLVSKKFIKGWYTGEIGAEEQERNLKIWCDRSMVQKASEPYYAAIRAREAQEETERLAKLPPSPPPSPEPTEEEKAEKQRKAILTREQERVKQQIKRAIKAGLPATLTLEQWLETLVYFDWKCAYCQEAPFALLEHFIPLTHEGGTTKDNCVPACHGCNSLKQSWHPSRIPLSAQTLRIQQGIKRVQEYLNTCGSEVDEDAS